ncbi:hypothetical protein NNJEOMEG_02897 [Fundidesulfovibrio magnetotacticus]|uniref:Peptidase C45 hydrolase domain-containing protein n=1 Tax=Fundidesulfovibrio magnetotacticus TaxID=2730080 RepID=A0A6V8LTJ1_9BACT|nr:carcinine hydrolase/isopenicillin-N N-acyltransferase family protein [Fundidesulfovibrio magnetotacticus]GFK95044.1 hypothetical protein NNJEOMEG_02897 [Fundidesulfovibrio magnetotacticus]
MPSRLLAVLLPALLLWAGNAPACTLWALQGADVAGGGSILVKNRDFAPDHPTRFALLAPRGGYRVAAMLSVTPEGRTMVVGGVNEKGLAVVTATAGTIPRSLRLERIREGGLVGAARTLLSRCASVDEVFADKETLARLAPAFALVADARRVAVLECSGTGYALEPVPAGAFAAHTNHPELPGGPEDLRQRPDAPGSVARLERIRSLLAQASRPLVLDSAASFSRDSVAGPDQSIFRTGSKPSSPRTLGMLAVWLPPGGAAPVLLARTSNPGEPEEERRLVLDEAFWRSAPAPGGSQPFPGFGAVPAH